MTGFVYLATPYSQYAPTLPRPAALDQAYEMACKARAELMKAGVPCFSPIAHCHGVSVHGGIDPLDHKIWLPAEAPMRRYACALVVYKAEGWDTSYGIGKEVEEFLYSGRPVFNWEPRLGLDKIAPAMIAICRQAAPHP